MKFFNTYGLLLLAVFPFFLSAQQKNQADIVEGVFYLKLDETQPPLSKAPTRVRLSVDDLLSDKSFLKVEPLKKNNSKTRSASSVLDGLYKVYVDESVPLFPALEALKHFGNVIYAEPVYRENLFYTPNDPNIAYGNQTYLDVIKAYEAWDITKGSSEIRIGIIDTGTDLYHEDLVAKIYKNENDPINGLDDDKNGYIDDYTGYDLADNDPIAQSDNMNHGIRVSGLAGADTDNAKGIAGIGFNTRLVPLKVFSSVDNTSFGNYDAILYAANNGVDIVCLSWGSVDSYSQANQDIINYAVLEKNMIIIAAAGNQNNEELYYPASYENVLSVAATTNSDAKAGFSSFNHLVDVVAPGNGILSTIANDGYGTDNGTSYSAPIVAGAAALVKAHYPELNARQITELIRATADDIYGVANNTDYFEKMGTGRLNILQALTASSVKALRAERITYQNQLNQTDVRGGDTLTLTFDVVSYLRTVDNATLQLSTSSDYVTLLVTEVSLGMLDTLSTLSFSERAIALAENTPPDTEVAIRFGFSDDSYEDFQYVIITTAPDYVNFGNDNVKLTVAGNGNLGHADDEGKEGLGLSWNGNKVAHSAGLILAGPNKQVMDNVPFSPQAIARKSDFTTQSYLKLAKPDVADLVAFSRFTDATAAEPIGLEIDQNTYAFKTGDYLIQEYRLINTTSDTLKNLASALFINWDLDVSSANRSYYDPEQNLIITHSVDNETFSGIRAFYDAFPVHQAMDIDSQNGHSADLDDFLTDSAKYALTVSQRFDSAGMSEAGNDVAILLAQDSISIAPSASQKVTFLLSLATSKEELLLQMDQAYTSYQKILSLPPLLESCISCNGATIEINPKSDTLYRFYSDPYSTNLIGTGSSVPFGPITKDTALYVVNVSRDHEGEIERIEVKLLDNVADFSMTKDTLFLSAESVNTVTFQDESYLPESWHWDFGNGLTANVQHPTVSFTETGTYEISLSIENAVGCSGTISKTLLVAERPDKPLIQDLIICENESPVLIATNSDSIAIYSEQNDKKPAMQTPETQLGKIATDTCVYVTNIAGPFESLKQKVCIRVDRVLSSFSYGPDTTSADHSALLVNTSEDPYRSKWYVDEKSAGTERTISVPIAKEEYVIALVNETSHGCTDSLSTTLRFTPSPGPPSEFLFTCPGDNITLQPSNGQVFGFYADANLDSLIKKGRTLQINSITESFTIFVTGLDSILPSPAAEIIITPENVNFSIAATPDTLILSANKTAQFRTSSDSLVNWSWYRSGVFQESISDPILYFDSAAVYEIVVHTQTMLGCKGTDTLQYVVLAEEMAPLYSDKQNHLRVFPNPTTGCFTIKNLPPNATVRLFDLHGKQIKQSTTTSDILSMDISAQKEGFYYLQIFPQNRQKIIKLYLEKGG